MCCTVCCYVYSLSAEAYYEKGGKGKGEKPKYPNTLIPTKQTMTQPYQSGLVNCGIWSKGGVKGEAVER